MKFATWLATALVCGSLSLSLHAQKPAQTPEASNPSGAPVLKDYDQAFGQVAERVMRSVVQIDVLGYSVPEHKDDNDSQLLERQRSLGSGVIVDPDGYIVTNNHVVAGAIRIRVTLSPATLQLVTGHTVLSRKVRVYDAKLIGTNRYADLAVIKIDEKNLPAMPLQANYAVSLGQMVFCIGSPEGLDHTVTKGIVSALGRQPDADRPMVYIQTDSPINPGNSGGPLSDRDGNLVGINTFIYTSGGGSEGLGFAIPEPVVRFAYAQIRKYGTVPATTIGAHAQTITPTLAAALQLPQDTGLVLSDVAPDGPAAAAGLHPKDIVVSVDTIPIDSLPKYVAFLYLHPQGQPLDMDVLRDGKQVSASITPIPAAPSFDNLSDLIDARTDLIPPLGIFVINLDRSLAEVMGTRAPSGVVVAGLLSGEPATVTDLTVGDIITTINGKPVKNKQDLLQDLNSFKAGDAVALEVERHGVTQYVAFEMD
jgi:serine protease Do